MLFLTAAGHLLGLHYSLLNLPVLNGLFSLRPVVQNDVPSRLLSVSFHFIPNSLKWYYWFRSALFCVLFLVFAFYFSRLHTQRGAQRGA